MKRALNTIVKPQSCNERYFGYWLITMVITGQATILSYLV